MCHAANHHEDALLQNFLQGGNYYYYMIHPSQFSEQYKHFWEDRAGRKQPSPEITALILRICACSSQYLPPELRKKIATDLVTDVKSLSEKFNDAAQKLTALIPPGKGGLINIQQIFLAGFWFKSESRWIESWHSLATAIREAQEQGTSIRFSCRLRLHFDLVR